LPNGRVIVAGGAISGSLTPTNTVEVYDPASGTWTRMGNMSVARVHHTATLLPSGKLLASGGFGQNMWLSSAEQFDPASGWWTTTGSFVVARGKHTATLTADGTVFAFGGESPFPLASGELYDSGLGFAWTERPSLNSNGPVQLGAPLSLNGARFGDRAKGSSGNSQDSTADVPVVQVRSIANDQVKFLSCTNWSTNSCQTEALIGLPTGPAFLTMFVNGIPNMSSVVHLDFPAIALRDAIKLPTGAFQFSFTNIAGATFTTLGTTDVGLPLGQWIALGQATEISPGHFQFTDVHAADFSSRFYKVRAD